MNKKTIEKVVNFSKVRDWEQYHTGKDLAVSLSLEASELLEVYQWSGKDEWVKEKTDKIKEELADILMYSILIADAYNLDLDEIVLEKLKDNERKYPVNLAKGKKEKYNELKK
ncbi:MAG: nucleotide pyrophosphohydrolase [Bacilli bacterium]